MIKSKSKLVFDIETTPKKLEGELKELFDSKLERNSTEENREKKEAQYAFRNPIYNQVVTIATLYENANGDIVEKVFHSRDNEKEIINDFITYISKFHGIFVHYNGLDFDIPILLSKCAIYNIIPSQKFSTTIRFRTDPHYDVMQVLTNWGKFGISLKEAVTAFEIKNPKDLLGDKDILSFMKSATDEEIQNYCMEDVRSTYELFKRVYQVYQ